MRAEAAHVSATHATALMLIAFITTAFTLDARDLTFILNVLNLKHTDFSHLRALSRPAFDEQSLYLPRLDLRRVIQAERRAFDCEPGRAPRALLQADDDALAPLGALEREQAHVA